MPSAASASAAPRCVRETDTFWWPSPGTSLKTGFVPWNRLFLAKHPAMATAALHNLSGELEREMTFRKIHMITTMMMTMTRTFCYHSFNQQHHVHQFQAGGWWKMFNYFISIMRSLRPDAVGVGVACNLTFHTSLHTHLYLYWSLDSDSDMKSLFPRAQRPRVNVLSSRIECISVFC